MESFRTMKNTKTIMLRAATLALLPVLCATPALAGFEWTPPPPAPAISARTPEAMPPVPAVPAATVDVMELMPIPGASDGVPPAAAPSPVPVSVPTPPPTTARVNHNARAVSPMPAIERESIAAPAPSPEILDALNSSGSYANVVGFGADIPLALAMGQIVPAEFAYSFASNVNPGLKVSWDGGKPWTEVLNNALAPHGLRADIAGTAVIVRQSVQAQRPLPTAPLSTPIENNKPNVPEAVAPHVPVSPLSGSLIAPSADPVTTPIGEGSANYPRRSPQSSSGIFGKFFKSEEPTKVPAAVRPPAEPAKVNVRSGLPPDDFDINPADDMSANETFKPATVANLEPAAALSPMPIHAPTALNTQRISYADESASARPDFFSERTHSESVRAQAGVFDPFQVSFWQADNNANLRQVLNAWADQAGVEVIWDSGQDYTLPASVSLHGTFPEAVSRLFDLYGKAEPRPQGKLHPNLPQGPAVLVVESFP